MSALATINRRGACPALAAPMQTGDGLLARLNPVSQGLTPKQLIGLCKSAGRHGSGIVEITARGSIQVRGLSAESAVALADDINELSIDVHTGTAIAMGPLAGLDAGELADPRPLAGMIRAGIAKRGLSGKLAPKVSVVVDGGGIWRLDGLQADVRCEATDAGKWRVEIASEEATARPVGTFDADEACEAALHVLEELARLGRSGRARDLPGTALVARDKPQVIRLGDLELANGRKTAAIALPFGSVKATVLSEFAKAAQAVGAVEFRPAPPRSLIVLLESSNADQVLEAAAALGFVTDARDPVMRIFACPGSAGCTFGHFDTRRTARDLARAAAALFGDGTVSVHVSGCSKGCAHPSATTLALVGDEKSVGIVVGGTARSLPLVHSRPKPLAEALGRLAARLDAHDSAAEGLARLSANELSDLFRQGNK